MVELDEKTETCKSWLEQKLEKGCKNLNDYKLRQ